MGTQAHEWFRAHQQISPDLANSQQAALAARLEEYPDQLGIALTDCITMDAFLRDFGVEPPVAIRACAMTLATRLNGVKKPLHIMKSWELIHRVKRWFSLTIWIYAKRLSYTATSLPACN